MNMHEAITLQRIKVDTLCCQNGVCGLCSYRNNGCKAELHKNIMEVIGRMEARIKRQDELLDNLGVKIPDDPMIAEPRTNTPVRLESVNIGDRLWLEFKDNENVELVEIRGDGLSPSLMCYKRLDWDCDCRFNVDKPSYGECWRLWKYKPTDDERGVAMWSG